MNFAGLAFGSWNFSVITHHLPSLSGALPSPKPTSPHRRSSRNTERLITPKWNRQIDWEDNKLIGLLYRKNPNQRTHFRRWLAHLEFRAQLNIAIPGNTVGESKEIPSHAISWCIFWPSKEPHGKESFSIYKPCRGSRNHHHQTGKSGVVNNRIICNTPHGWYVLLGCLFLVKLASNLTRGRVE
jgi:hypothetical protein